MGIVSINKKIETGRAKRLVRNFKNQKWFQACGSMGEEDTKSVFFNRTFCDELIRELQQEGIDGLRVYFGAYEKEHKNPNRKGKLTVIFVTTNNHFKNKLDNPEDPEHGPKDDEELEDADINKVKLSELNDGALCPPLGCNDDSKNELWPNP